MFFSKRNLESSKQTILTAIDRFQLASNSCNRIGLIHGGDGNLGDEAMADAARQLLVGTKPLRFLHPKQERRLKYLGLSGSKYFNLAFLGGGTLICPTWSKEVHEALNQGLSLYTLGTGVGSNGFHQEDIVNLNEWKPLLAEFKGLGVRGPRSKAALESIGITNSEVIGDLALALASESLQIPSNPPKFAINISTPSGKDYRIGEYSRLQELESVLQKLLREGWQPVPIAMHPWDIEPIKMLMQRIGLEDVDIQLTKDKESFFRSVSLCRFTAAVRLHTAVLSCCVGVPPLMLGYREKCLDFMESMQLEDLYIDLKKAKPFEITEKILMLSNSPEVLQLDILRQANKWKEKINKYVNSIIF